MIRAFYAVFHWCERWLYRARLGSFAARARVAAKLCGSELELTVARDVRLGRRCRVEVASRTTNRLSLAPGVRMGDGVSVQLRGGSVEVQARTDIRRFATLNASGQLRIGPDAMVGPWAFVHCDELVSIEGLVLIAERVTIADSDHVRSGSAEAMHHTMATKPVRIGHNVWIGAGAVVTSGVDIGDRSFVGANAVVTTDVPTGVLAAGNPARVVRALEHHTAPEHG